MLVRLTLVLGVLTTLLISPTQAGSIDYRCDAPAVMALHHCVEHAVDQGYIDSPGVAHSLLTKLDRAAAALDRGQPHVAASQLEAFIHEVDAQSGVHIDPAHAAHLGEHARGVLDALEP